jgi:hypothetical protein
VVECGHPQCSFALITGIRKEDAVTPAAARLVANFLRPFRHVGGAAHDTMIEQQSNGKCSGGLIKKL